MKNLLRNIKISLFFISTSVVLAAPFGTVSTTSGTVFVIKNGNTKMVQNGTKLWQGDELITEEMGSVTFIDYYDRQYHMSGSAHIELEQNEFKLNRGYVWVQSYQQEHTLVMRTANGLGQFNYGEGIFSFDNVAGKTQLLSVTGKFTISNILDPQFSIPVQTGQFSFVDSKLNDGRPRDATQIGYKSYEKLVGLFPNVKTESQYMADQKRAIAKKTARRVIPNRSPASAPSSGKFQVKASPKPVVKNTDGLSRDLINLYNNGNSVTSMTPIKKKTRVRVFRGSNVKTRVFGKKHIDSTPSVVTNKIPRPVVKKTSYNKSDVMKVVHEVDTEVENRKMSWTNSTASKENYVSRKPAAFESSLKTHYKKQKRHPEEVNKLIDELQNYKDDYQKKY